MPRMLERPTELKGTWEEVAAKAGNLAGKRVKMPIYAEEDTEEPETLAELLAGRPGGADFEHADLPHNHRKHFARIMNARQEEGRI
jgi:hypothetical protein